MPPLRECDARRVRPARHKYVFHRWGDNSEQLLDFETDTDEMINFAIERLHHVALQHHC